MIGKELFLNRLNNTLGNASIRVVETPDSCFEITCHNGCIQESRLTPSEQFEAMIKEQAIACFGKPVVFNNTRHTFWVESI